MEEEICNACIASMCTGLFGTAYDARQDRQIALLEKRLRELEAAASRSERQQQQQHTIMLYEPPPNPPSDAELEARKSSGSSRKDK